MLKGDGVEILATHDGAATAVRWRGIWAFAGHPELTSDRRVFVAFTASNDYYPKRASTSSSPQ